MARLPQHCSFASETETFFAWRSRRVVARSSHIRKSSWRTGGFDFSGLASVCRVIAGEGARATFASLFYVMKGSFGGEAERR